MRGLRIKRKLFAILFFVFFVSGCTTVSRLPSRQPTEFELPSSQSYVEKEIKRKDTVHIVAPGETLWRIGKMYDVSPKVIARANSLNKSENLKKGARIIVPGAAPIKPVVSLYPTEKWKYIIIHHSATDVGNALVFNRAHNLRGFTRGLGYHFVIDNGTRGKIDGQIEVSPRWIKQQDGAHCRAGGMNHKGIGICLVGNFNKERVSEKQMQALVYLVNRLRRYYEIPLSHIKGHGQVSGASTDCPGKIFPWGQFWKRLKAAAGK